MRIAAFKSGILPSAIGEEAWEDMALIIKETRVEYEETLISMYSNDPNVKSASDFMGGASKVSR